MILYGSNNNKLALGRTWYSAIMGSRGAGQTPSCVASGMLEGAEQADGKRGPFSQSDVSQQSLEAAAMKDSG